MTAENSCPECRQGKHDNCTGQALDPRTDEMTQCPCQRLDHGIPFKTYAGTTGHSGTDTSRERVEREDNDGTTSRRQSEVWLLVSQSGLRGMTVKELREVSGLHHGQASSALTNLHRGGALRRLTERRDRCKVYVTPPWVLSRDCEPYARRQPDRAAELEEAVKDHLDALDFELQSGQHVQWPERLAELVDWKDPKDA